MYPHCDRGCDFAWPRSGDDAIRRSVLWEVLGEVHRGFMDHGCVFGNDYRLELLGRQIETEKQSGMIFAGHDRARDVWLKG